MWGALARFGSVAAGALMKSTRGATGAVLKVPGVRSVIKQTAVGAAVYGAGNALFGGGGGGGGLPALPGMSALPGAGMPSVVGNRGIFQNDPNVVAAIKPWAISKANLRVSYRSPVKGFVIRYDEKGDPYAVPKDMARKYLGWKAGHKPPISVGDYQALKRADRTVKKMRKVYSMIQRVDKNIGKGGKVRVAKKGGSK